MTAGPVSVVIPTFNEAASIGAVIAELPKSLVAEVIVADGGSGDGTQAVAQAAGAIVLNAGPGYGRACSLGAAAAVSDIIAFMDGDGADRGDRLADIAAPILAKTHDLVLASRTRGAREAGSMLWHQVFAGRAAGWAMGALYGVSYSDMCAFRMIRREILGNWRLCLFPGHVAHSMRSIGSHPATAIIAIARERGSIRRDQTKAALVKSGPS
jgi:glycosyltransferase involved in cell wall biosynthesis